MNSSKINQKNIHVKKNSKLMRKIEKKPHTLIIGGDDDDGANDEATR